MIRKVGQVALFFSVMNVNQTSFVGMTTVTSIKCSTKILVAKLYKQRSKKRTSSVGIEPTTSRLTVERANRLRHEDSAHSLQ